MSDEVNIVDELKRLSRRMEDLDKTVSKMSADREMFEDILSRLVKVETAIGLQRSTLTETAKNIKADIKEVSNVVEAKVDEGIQNIDEKTVVVKSSKQSILDKIFKKAR